MYVCLAFFLISCFPQIDTYWQRKNFIFFRCCWMLSCNGCIDHGHFAIIQHDDPIERRDVSEMRILSSHTNDSRQNYAPFNCAKKNFSSAFFCMMDPKKLLRSKYLLRLTYEEISFGLKKIRNIYLFWICSIFACTKMHQHSVRTVTFKLTIIISHIKRWDCVVFSVALFCMYISSNHSDI